VLSALAFNIIPTVFEVGLVTGILVCMYVCHLVSSGVHLMISLVILLLSEFFFLWM